MRTLALVLCLSSWVQLTSAEQDPSESILLKGSVPVRKMAFSLDGKLLATVHKDETLAKALPEYMAKYGPERITIWGLDTRKPLLNQESLISRFPSGWMYEHVLSPDKLIVGLGPEGGSSRLVSPNRKTYATSKEGKIELFDTTNGKLILEMTRSPVRWSHAALSFSPDGKLALLAQHDGSPSTNPCRAIGARLMPRLIMMKGASTSTMPYYTCTHFFIVNTQTGQLIYSSPPSSILPRLEFSPNSKILAIIEEYKNTPLTESFWPPLDWENPRATQRDSGVKFSNVVLLDIYSGLQATIRNWHLSTTDVEFTPNSKQLAVSDDSGAIRIYDVNTLFIPVLNWSNPFSSTNRDTILLKFAFQTYGSPREIQLRINDEDYDLDLQGRDPVDELTISVPLLYNEYRFKARVIDENHAKSRWLLGQFEYDAGIKGVRKKDVAQRTPKIGTYHKKKAIVIGVSEYKNLPKSPKKRRGLSQLRFAHNDAIKFSAFLRTIELSGGDWKIHELINKKATEKAIDETLSRVLNNAETDDLIFIFFSGHGRAHNQYEEEVYLLPYDFDPDNYKSGIFYNNLRTRIAKCAAEHIIVFIDACRSGQIPFEKGGKAFNQKIFGDMLDNTKPNKIIFSSGKGAQNSHEDETLDMGVFSHYLIRGLQGEAADKENPELVDLFELSEFVTKRVWEHTTKDPSMEPQMPTLWSKEGYYEPNFPVSIRLKDD